MRTALVLKSLRFVASRREPEGGGAAKVGDEAEQKALRRLFALVKKRALADDMLIHRRSDDVARRGFL